MVALSSRPAYFMSSNNFLFPTQNTKQLDNRVNVITFTIQELISKFLCNGNATVNEIIGAIEGILEFQDCAISQQWNCDSLSKYDFVLICEWALITLSRIKGPMLMVFKLTRLVFVVCIRPAHQIVHFVCVVNSDLHSTKYALRFAESVIRIGPSFKYLQKTLSKGYCFRYNHTCDVYHFSTGLNWNLLYSEVCTVD